MAETKGMNWQSIGESALTGGAGAVAGGILGLIGARVQRKQQEKLMAKQFQYQQKAFEMENARQDWLMQNSQSIAKSALQQAGYSTADPNGTGVTPGATGTLDSPTQSAPSADIGASAVSGMRAANDMRLASAQIDLAESQAEKNRAETEMQHMLNDLKRVYGEPEVLQNLYKMGSETFLNIANAMKADQDRLNSIKISDATVKNIEQRLEMDWMKLEPELAAMCEQVEVLKQQRKVSEAQEKAVYQDIKESNARISRIVKENQLTDADIAVAKASEKLRKQELKTEKENTRAARSAASSAKSRAAIDKVEADAKQALGPKYYAAKEVVDEITKTGERIGNTVSSFIPFTDKVETSHDAVETRYDGDGNVVGEKTTHSTDSRSRTSRRGK